VGSLAHPARVAIVNEIFLEVGVQPVYKCMMHYAIPETGSKYLSEDGFLDYENTCRSWPPLSGIQFFPQVHKIVFKVQFELQSAWLVAFVAPAAMVGCENFFD